MPYPLLFPVGSADGDTLCGSITILDDILFEGEEFFDVIVFNLIFGIKYMSSFTQVIIMDNEGT